MAAIDRLMEDSVDIHVHFAPDPRVERRSDAVELAQAAKAMGMRGVVLKSHEYPTHPVAYTVSQMVPGVALLGGGSFGRGGGWPQRRRRGSLGQNGCTSCLDANLLSPNRPTPEGVRGGNIYPGWQ